MSNTVAGRPVTGELSSRHRDKADQKSIEEFVVALDALFAYPEVESVRWGQYTPSFNDGDPCVFSFGEFEVKLFGNDEGGEREDGFLSDYHVNEHFNNLMAATYSYSNKHPIAELLDSSFGYRHVDAYVDALETAFGDPAEVIATREGFHVEDYDCGY